jgi:cytoskeletal protein CcmA (bactofilin family)
MFDRDTLTGKGSNDLNHAGAGTSPTTPDVNATQLMPGKSAASSDLPATKRPAAVVAPLSRVSEGSRLIVGHDIKLKGVEITDCDTLVVEGRVEATMDSRVVQIAEGGFFKGEASADIVEVRGRFEGVLTARTQFIIYATGRVSGTIRYKKIKIEEGGEIEGEVSTFPGSEPDALPATSSPES